MTIADIVIAAREAAISVSDMGMMIDSAKILLELVDIEASNGVIHVIDAVIVPGD